MRLLTRLMLFLIPLSMGATSCGVMFGGSKFDGIIRVQNHPNAMIYVDGTRIGQGRAEVSYPRNKPLTIELRQDSCEPKIQTYGTTFRTGNFIATLISSGPVGMVVDLGTGASYKPDHLANPGVERLTDKVFEFYLTYEGCPAQSRKLPSESSN